MFKCLLGLAYPTSGTILYGGKPLDPATFERIAYVPERSVLYDWMTVAEHVEMTRRAFAPSIPSARKNVDNFQYRSEKRARRSRRA